MSGGCQHQYGNTFVDPYAGQDYARTASSRRLGELEGTPSSQQHRGHPTIFTQAADSAVTHGPLLFEDPLLMGASQDGRFAWTWEDYLGLGYGDARFLMNLVAAPTVSMVVYPPWIPAYSTGFGDSHAAPLTGSTPP